MRHIKVIDFVNDNSKQFPNKTQYENNQDWLANETKYHFHKREGFYFSNNLVLNRMLITQQVCVQIEEKLCIGIFFLCFYPWGKFFFIYTKSACH